MKTSQAGLDLIKQFEGFRAKPYLCSAGVPTIGYGSTRYADGTPATTNFPLPQDTAVFTDTNPGVSSSITLNAAYNLGTLDFSTRTNALTFSIGSISALYYGNIILSPAISLTGTGSLLLYGIEATLKLLYPLE